MALWSNYSASCLGVNFIASRHKGSEAGDKGERNTEGVTAGWQMWLWGLFKRIFCSLSLLCGRAKCNNDQSCCSETVLEGDVARCLHGFNELYRDSHYTSVSSNKSTDVDLLVWICAQAKGNIIKVGETCIFRLCEAGFPPVSSRRLKTCRFHWLKLP